MYVCISCDASSIGTDIHSEPCQRFFKDGLATSFLRILTDDAVTTWKPDIQVCGGRLEKQKNDCRFWMSAEVFWGV